MSTFQIFTLITHVLTGVLAIGLVQLVFMHSLKVSPSWKYLSRLSAGSVVLFFISWVSSAYYYVTYYGKAVKPIILSGTYPWAHQIVMESKEHIFILLPFLAVTIWMLIQLLKKQEDASFKMVFTILTLVTLLLGVGVAGAGVIISGSVR